ncbi:sulfite exporter TauE/SafE family protein [Corynebacterium pacaense]|uniref:sulfite exporter TauE/SafE family protein n=1 Tax=Corynebacterium pacaense TaxID=1816684 RepID=UPI0009B9B2F6|nr:sulfite exporter TauE/SafE family protein [Corynebacterium pacaense]
MDLAIVFLTVFAGAFIQRLSGMGMGLVAGPVLSIVLGPVEGILVVNVMAVLNATLTTISVHRDVDWRRFGLISSVMIVGAVPAAILLKVVEVPIVLTLVGSMILLALAVTTFGRSYIPVARGRGWALVTGVVGGFMNTLAGIAAPALTVYAQASRWDHASFAATLQPIFFVAGLISILVKVSTGAASFAHTTVWIWPVGVAAMIVGILAGTAASRRVEKDSARRIAVALAAAGASVVLYRGVAGLL